MSEPQRAEFDVALAEPEERQDMIDRQNQASMQALGAMGAVMPPPLVPPRRDS